MMQTRNLLGGTGSGGSNGGGGGGAGLVFVPHPQLTRIGSHGKLIDRGNGTGLNGINIVQPLPGDSNNINNDTNNNNQTNEQVRASNSMAKSKSKSPQLKKTPSRTRNKLEYAIKSSKYTA